MDLSKLKGIKDRIDQRSEGNNFSNEMKFIISNGWNVVRVIGDPEYMLRAWIKDGQDPAGKPKPYVIKADGPIMAMLNQLFNFTVEKSVVDGKNHRVYDLQVKDPTLFKSLQDAGWKVREMYLTNCIPRMPQKDSADGQMKMMSAVYKHTQLLVTSASEMGVGPMAMGALAAVAENYGDPEGYDVVFKRKGSGFDTEYECFSAAPLNPEYGQYVKQGALTPEEMAYACYDLKAFIVPTPLAAFLADLGATIQVIDERLGTHYLDSIRDEASREAPPETKNGAAVAEDPIRATFPNDAKLESCENPQCGKEFPAMWPKCPYCGTEYNVS